MNLDSLSFALSQISYAVTGLTKKNFKSNIQEISNLVHTHGTEADRHRYRCLFSLIDFSSDARNTGRDSSQILYLSQECQSLIAKPNFVSILCYSLDNPLHQQKTLKPSPQLFPQISKVLKLDSVQEIALGLAALHSSDADTRKFATQFVKHRLGPLISSYIEAESRVESSLANHIEVLHLILSHIVSPLYREQLGVTNEQKKAFLSALSKVFPRERVPIVLAPLLYRETRDITKDKLLDFDTLELSADMVDTSLAEYMKEQGYAFTKSVEHCKRDRKSVV